MAGERLDRELSEVPLMNLDDLFDEMQEDELHDAEFLSPREYAKLRGMAPQLVYYYIRTGKIEKQRCICGRPVVRVQAADEATGKGPRPGDVAGVARPYVRDDDPDQGEGSVVSSVREVPAMEGPEHTLRDAGDRPDEELDLPKMW